MGGRMNAAEAKRHDEALARAKTGTRVVVTDLETGESEEAVITNDYLLITDGNAYLDGIQAYPKSGTVVLTVKRRKS